MKTRSYRILSLAVRVVPIAAIAVLAQTASAALAEGPRII
jgi:hypothetical protein